MKTTGLERKKATYFVQSDERVINKLEVRNIKIFSISCKGMYFIMQGHFI